MTANKMPEMPEPCRVEVVRKLDLDGEYYREELAVYAEADVIATRRACYLAGLEAAKACVPARLNGEPEWVAGFNACRATTLTNLTALEQEAKK